MATATDTQRICPECGSETTVWCDDKELGEAGSFTVSCTSCHWEMFMPEESTQRKRVEALREIVKEHSAKRIEGILVDAFTASMLVQVYDALSRENRAKFLALPLARMADVGWKVTKKK